MSRTINAHSYAFQGSTTDSAQYAGTVSGQLISARFATLATKQGGKNGDRISRTFLKEVTVDGIVYPVSVGYVAFLPDGVDVSELDTIQAELVALMAESGFVTAVKGRSVE